MHTSEGKFKINSPNARFGVIYQTIDEEGIIEAIKVLQEQEDTRDLTFVDLGCGKGRALMVAANLGFKTIIGVEFVHELAETARKNLQKLGLTDAVVVESDAANYRFPESDMVIYLFNPFSAEVMQKVVANLKESLSKKLYIIYVNPQCGPLFDASGFLTPMESVPKRPDIQIWRRS